MKKQRRRNRTGESKHSPRRLAAADRQRRCLELAAAGIEQKVIAKIVNLSRSGVSRAIDAGLAKAISPSADEYRAKELLFLLARRRALFTRATAGWDPDAERLLLLNSKAVRELLGLDAPAKIEHSGQVGIINEVKRRYAHRKKEEADR